MERIVLEGLVEVEVEDSGMAQIAEVGPDDAPFFVRLHSWSDAAIHPTMDRLKGQKVRVTIEVL